MKLARIRLVALDLDGTLVRTDGVCSRITRRAVRAASASGIRIVLATGRTAGSAGKLSRWLGLREPLICSNGAHVAGPSGEDWRFVPIPASVLPDLIHVLRDAEVPFEAHVKGGALVEHRFLDWFRRGRWSLRHAVLRAMGARLSSVARVVDDGTIETMAGQITKIVLDACPELVSRISSTCRSDFRGRLRCFVTTTTYGNALLEIQDSSVDKGRALSLVAERLSVQAEETAAVGDGDNDIDLLRVSGLGVAVANASARLALAADRFTFSADNDGVAHFLAEILEARDRTEARG